jgi:hypothetical protein
MPLPAYATLSTSPRSLAEQVDRRVLHRDLRTDVAVDPLHHGVLVGRRALGDEVVDVGRPVLDRRVSYARALLGDDLDHGGVQRVGRVDRCRAPFDVVHVGTFVRDDQRPLELAHVLGVDPEVSLERDVDVHARWHVDERATRPHRRVQRGELVVVRRDQRAEVLLHQVRVIAERRVHVGEQDTDVVELLLDLVVDDLGLVLRRNPAEVLLLGLGDPELVPRALDVLGQFLPVLGLLLGRADEVVDVGEVDVGQIGAPPRHRTPLEVLQRLQPELAHPVRLGLQRRDLLDHVG